MGVLGRLGRGFWALGRAPRRAAERQAADDQAPLPRPTTREAVLLARYLAARWLLAWLWGPFGFVYALVALVAALAWWVSGQVPAGAVAAVPALVVALVHAAIARPMRRFGRVRQLSELDNVAQDALVTWWPSLRRELRRVGLAHGPLGILRMGLKLARGHLSDAQRAALGQVDWPRILPRDEWRRAHRILAEVDGGAG